MDRYHPHAPAAEGDYKQQRLKALKLREQLVAKYGADWRRKASSPEIQNYYDAEASVRKNLISQYDEQKRVEEERRKAADPENRKRVEEEQRTAEKLQMRREALQRAENMPNYPSTAEQIKAGLHARYGAGWEQKAKPEELQQYHRVSDMEAKGRARQKELLYPLSARVRLDDLQRQNDSLMMNGFHPFQLMSNRQEAGQLTQYLAAEHPELAEDELGRARVTGKGMMLAGKYIFPTAAPLFNGINNSIDVAELAQNPSDSMNQAQVAADVLSPLRSRRTKLKPFGIMGDALSAVDIYNEASQYGRGGSYSWFQDGGNVLPGVMLGPREMAQYMARRWYQDGGGTGMPAGVPSPREMEMQALAQKIFPRQAAAGSPLLSGTGKKEAPKPVKQRVDSAPVGQWVRRREEVPVDPAAAVENFGMPSAEEVEREHLVKQLKEEWLKQRLPQLQRQRLQAELIDAGVPEQSARIAAIQGEKGMAENIRQRLGNYRQGFEDEREDLRRITMHPDFDPTKPIRDQAYLNDDNSFRARTLRGSNTMGSTNSGTVNFLSDAITGEGRAFANITMDAENRYWKPIEREGWRGVPTALSNAGWDVLGLLGGAAVSQRVANRLASRGLPEASAALERELLQSWRSPNVIVDNSFPGDVSEEDFLKKYLAPGSDELAEKGERELLDNLDKGTLKELKDLFAKSMPGAEAELNKIFNNPEELKQFLSQLPRGMDKEFLKDKLQKLPLDELKNYFKGRKLDVGSPNEGGAPWNFGTTSSNRIRGPYSSEAMKKDPWIRDMFGGNADEVEQKKELFDFLLNPVTAQRMGGEISRVRFKRGGRVPALPMIGIRRGIR